MAPIKDKEKKMALALDPQCVATISSLLFFSLYDCGH